MCVMSMARVGAKIQELAMALGFEPRSTKSFGRRSRWLKVEAQKEHSWPEPAVLPIRSGSNAALWYDPVQFQE